MNPKRTLQKLHNSLTVAVIEKTLIGVVIASFLISIVAIHASKSYSSDGVANQVVLQSLEKGEKLNAVISTDTWIIKTPLYLVQDMLMPNSATKLLLGNIAIGLGFIACVVFFLRKATQDLRGSRLNLALIYLPLAWFLGLGIFTDGNILSSRAVTFMTPNLRNVELGASLVFILWLTTFLQTGKRLAPRQYWRPTVVFVALGLFVFNDPYFLYTLVLPGLTLAGIAWINGKTSLLRSIGVAGLTGLALAVYVLLHIVATTSGLTILSVPRRFANLADLGTNLLNMLHGQLTLFSSDIWGLPFSASSLPTLLNFILMSIGLVCVYFAVKRSMRKMDLRLGIVLIFAFNTLIYWFTTLNDPTTARYLIFAVVCEVILFSMTAPSVSNRRLKILLVCLLALGVLTGIGQNTRYIVRQARHPTPAINDEDRHIVDVVRSENLKKGYTGFWDAGINTYFADSNINFLPVTCDGQSLHKLYWLINTETFETRVQKTFYLYSYKAVEPATKLCTAEILQTSTRLRPSKTVKIDDNYTLYEYDEDIGNHMDYVVY